MRLQFLISTLNNNIVNNPGIQAILDNSLVINQYTDDRYKSDLKNAYNYNECGLSRSRNHALRLADAEICYLCDDDVEFAGSYDEILNEYEMHPDADIIIFNRYDENNNVLINRKPRFYYPTILSLIGVCSINISFRSDSVRNKNIYFDEDFSLNCKYETGAEFVFLADCYRNNLNIYFSDLVVMKHPLSGSGNTYASDKSIFDKGAVMARVFRTRYLFMNILFSAKSYGLYKEKYSFIRFLMIMNKGSRDYLNSMRAG